MFSRYESMLLIGVVVLEESAKGGHWSEVPHLLAAPSAGQMHTGSEQAAVILQSLADHPAHLTQDELRARLGLVGCDGAACAGGEDAIHSSTRAAEKIWEAAHPGDDPFAPPLASATEWDLFHRLDIAMARAIGDTPAAVQIFDVARVMGSLFGVGDGRVILRSAADAIGEQRLRVPDQGGTRKIVALGNTVEHLLKTHRTLHAALHARMGQMKDGGRGKQSMSKLIDVGRQVSALDFVTFTVGVGDILRTCITPLALGAQTVAGSHQEMVAATRETLQKLSNAKAALERLSFWCFASVLLSTRLTRVDLQALWRALAFSTVGRLVPRLALSLRQLMFAQEFGGCTLTVVAPVLASGGSHGWHTLSPCCQCPSMLTRPGTGPRRAIATLKFTGPKWVGDEGCREIKVPEWVANSVYHGGSGGRQVVPVHVSCRG